MCSYIGVQKRFWMQGFILFAVFVGLGYHWLSQQYPQITSLLAVVACVVVGLQAAVTVPTVIPLTVKNTYLEDYARSELESLPTGAVYIALGDYQENAMLYLHQFCRERPDVSILYLPYASYMWYNNTQLPLYSGINWPGTVYHPYGSILRGKGGNAFNLTEFVKANIGSRRLFITSAVIPKEKLEGFNLWPVGLFFEVGLSESMDRRFARSSTSPTATGPSERTAPCCPLTCLATSPRTAGSTCTTARCGSLAMWEMGWCVMCSTMRSSYCDM